MNQRDRSAMGRAYDILTSISGLRARNPADIKTISIYHSKVDPILRSVGFALIDLSAGDYDLASDNFDDAERDLAAAKRLA